MKLKLKELWFLYGFLLIVGVVILLSTENRIDLILSQILVIGVATVAALTLILQKAFNGDNEDKNKNSNFKY